MRKRMTSLLLTLVMLLSLVPAMGVTASAEETWETVNSYAELQTAVKAKKEYIKLGRDIDTKDFHYSGGGLDIADWLTFENQTCTLDLNGKTLSLLTRMGDMPTFMRVYEGSNLTIKDSQVGGQITGEFENANAGDRYLIHMNKSSLTLEGGTFRATAKPYGTNVNVIDYLESNVTIKDGVTISQPEHYAYGGGGSALKGRGYALCEQEREFNYGDKVSHVVIDGGIFDGWVRLIGYPDTNGSVQINGGTFKKGVQALYVAKKNNSDPTVTVNGGTFEDNVYLQDWDWKESLYMPYRLNGGTFKGTVDLHAVNNITVYQKPESNPNVALGLNECFGYSAVVTPDGTFAGPDAKTGVLKKTGDYDYDMWLEGTASNPVRIIPNAWGMKSVTLDGNPIDYAKDFMGEVKEITNDTEHTLTFTWKPLADELRGAGYSYDAKCERYVPGATSTPTNFILDGTEYYTYTFLKGADPTLYSFDLHLNLKKGTSNVGIVSNEHIVRLLVSEAPPAPPAPVAHSIKIINGFGTANPTTAIAGETITVKANDRTADNMMFTRWNTDTPGVTFADATKQETTFVMPDCDVKVNPGFQQVSFRKQPLDSWPQVNHGSKATVTFSAPITKWELKEGNTTVASSGNLFINTGNPITVDIPAQSSEVEKTYTVVVTANGQKFSSDEFKVKWVSWPQAPAVEFTPADGTQFVGEIEVIASDALYAGEEIFEIVYTTDGTDPKDNTAATNANTDSVHITLTETTTIKARTYNGDAAADAEKWGPLATATFTKYSDTTLPKPTITPEGMTYTGSIKAYLTAPALDGVKLEYQLVSPGEEPASNQWHEYNPEIGIDVYEFGTITLYARSFKEVDMGDHVEHLTSENVSATYTRTYSAAIDNVTVSGKVGETLTQDVVIRMNGDRFENVTAGEDVSNWFTNRPAGLTAKVKALSEADGYHENLTVTISGTPEAASIEPIAVTIPRDKLYANGTVDLTVLSNPKAVYNIGTDAVHTHDYTGQPYLYLDPGNHYQECTANDGGYNIQPHAFTPWTDNGNGTHSRHCTVCKMTDSSTYTETANHNWQWVVDAPATPNAAGKQHEECVDCHAKRSENTEIPMLTSIMVEHLTVAKPVKDAAAAMATTTDSSYTVANTEWMAADGTPLAIGGKFQPGTVYTVKITLETAGAGVFSVKSTYNTIEGKTATVSPNLTGDNHADSVILTYTFDATEGTYVPTKPAITTVALPDGKVGDVYSQTLAATGTNPITWGIEAGTLPDGLTLVGDTIKGTPSKAGEFKFTVKATNGGGSDTKELTIKVADAEAAKYHNVTLTGAGTGATGAGSHAAGTTVNIYAGTKSGYTFNGWTSDDVTVLSASSKNASFVMPDKDVTVKANWVYNGGGSSGGGYTYYTIKATAGVNGSISPTGNVSVREGRDQTFTITPNNGYAVAKVLIDSKNVGAVKSYTFENVKKNHTIEVVFMKASGNPQTGVFVDVPEGSYYEEAVNWAVEKGITTGTDATHFSPDGICTRAQAVTFLWRAAGSPAAKSAVMPFADVKVGSYYYDAVLWAVENGITKGTSDTMFSPDATCSRAQIVTFLWRSQKSPAAGTANPFTDVKASAYYADAVLWAVKEDVTKGTTNTTFSPDANCTRAQIVTFIWRALAE
ncbi:S-layer homology domain-containing protein [Intestinimonas butyriciproducens]|uniref:Putative repeat protein (TIGR02543 family) n=1 Tax=Intestinimonas butyriciproducens TaxID=1297617 RepID=A0A2U1C1D6_9FIRM|nr:S-layer homology domain-containing protein [Intestinimonas butyriciproducens]MCR1906698.1 S-layer homology domain-containing protein [Intestinimonas butyriciproducens]PVY54717.1 putative repeat protein (TIGR02543 family) [Intestinimonas butyriciproducens]QBB66842.1 Type IV fimbrial biogenesis protein PilY1 [Intestinimonas butyriciproducens]